MFTKTARTRLAAAALALGGLTLAAPAMAAPLGHDAQVELETPGAEPDAAARRQHGWLGDLRHPEDAGEERPGLAEVHRFQFGAAAGHDGHRGFLDESLEHSVQDRRRRPRGCGITPHEAPAYQNV